MKKILLLLFTLPLLFECNKAEPIGPDNFEANLPQKITFWGDVNYPEEVVTMEFTWQNKELLKIKESYKETSWIDVFETNSNSIIRYKGRELAGKTSNTDTYDISPDKKSVTVKWYSTYLYLYDDKYRLVQSKQINIDPKELLNLTWDKTVDQVLKIQDEKNIHTISKWSGPKNPLWEISKQSNFFRVFNPATYFYYLGQQIPDEWKTKNINTTLESTTVVDKTLDANGRISKIVATTGKVKTQEINIFYSK
jgi:hypothetical protein